ncbi:LacI family DNA-binding transcriptional regulator [Pseudalkalibacillus salsuginis]|uniref:LacI family DNA-binding transcriptional regulator n=1 Tax=Pseudalkalibacillus salsuginis TaxID=2910972 RepID=UPI001F2C16F8|nr:substrate-binding domain-containing protein [Pseudalkalibacillus salsuginis]MCF6410052.1 substrate-binding domain-containing protein [Pseudalkalibacillus salsuginis]
MNKVTIGDVAKRAGVSKSTVSQYLNERFDYMGEETRSRIKEAISELNYQPNVVARSLKKKNTSTIGVIVANILHTFSTQVIRSIEDVCSVENVSTIVCNADDDPQKEKKYIETLLAKQVDGLIVFPTSGNMEIYQRLIDAKFPIVFMDRLVEGITVDTVMLDNERASRMAVNHLVQNGYERIAIITASLIENVTPRIERIEGYRKALESHKLPDRKEYIKAMEIQELKKGIKELFSLEEPPQAIITGNDLTLMEFLMYVTENEIKIGRDVGLVTIDEVSFATIHSPSLTTIAQPTFEMGTKAVNLLLKKIKQTDETEPGIYRYPPSIIARKSAEKEGILNE